MSQDPPRDQQQSLSKRKHRHPESSSLPQDHEAYGSSKQRKLRHPTVPPPAFWDGLSTVPLCESALRELDRRYAQRAPAGKDLHVSPEPTRRSRRLQARRTATDDGHPIADRLLRRCSPKYLTTWLLEREHSSLSGLSRIQRPSLTTRHPQLATRI